ncbi:unnamed protein product [Lupinus luteus]|uniref:Fatty acyl-CoA reductase n=1 Tax=Lupinus luteus TaxID=3873 RepID=A0AAV1WXT8_LUPLU
MLGLIDVELSEEILKEINIIVHSAAATNFDGSKATLKIEQIFISISTYVCGQAEGLIAEELILMAYVCGQTEGLVPEETIHMVRQQTGLKD